MMMMMMAIYYVCANSFSTCSNIKIIVNYRQSSIKISRFHIIHLHTSPSDGSQPLRIYMYAMHLSGAVILDGNINRDTVGQSGGTVPVNLPSAGSVGDRAGLPLLLRVVDERRAVLGEAVGDGAGGDSHRVRDSEADGLGLSGVDDHSLVASGRAVERVEAETTIAAID